MHVDITISVSFACESKGQQQVKPTEFFFFSHMFQVIKMKFDVSMKKFKMNILILFYSEILVIKGNNCSYRYTDCVRKLECGHTFTCLSMDLIQAQYGWYTTEVYILLLV